MADLISITTYKQAKAITSTKEDERLSIIIPAVSQLVKTYCGNTFLDYVTTPYTQYETIEYNTSELMLEEIPVLAISKVWTRANPEEAYSLLVANQDYVLNRRTAVLHSVNKFWPVGIESIKIEYTAGYTTLPEPITLALIDLTTYYLKDEYKVSKAIANASVQNTVSSSVKNNSDFPDHIKRILDMYRQI